MMKGQGRKSRKVVGDALGWRGEGRRNRIGPAVGGEVQGVGRGRVPFATPGVASGKDFVGHQTGVPPLDIDDPRVPMIDDSKLDPDLFVTSGTRSRGPIKVRFTKNPFRGRENFVGRPGPRDKALTRGRRGKGGLSGGGRRPP